MVREPKSFRLEEDVSEALRKLAEESPERYGVQLSQAQVLEVLIRREVAIRKLARDEGVQADGREEEG